MIRPTRYRSLHTLLKLRNHFTIESSVGSVLFKSVSGIFDYSLSFKLDVSKDGYGIRETRTRVFDAHFG